MSRDAGEREIGACKDEVEDCLLVPSPGKDHAFAGPGEKPGAHRHSQTGFGWCEGGKGEFRTFTVGKGKKPCGMAVRTHAENDYIEYCSQWGCQYG